MKKSFLLLCATACICYIGCKKNNNSTATNPNAALADSLKRTCVSPFVGPGDSSSFYLPTAFTPNGDGVNDVYKIIGANPIFTSFQLSIYDTLGTLIFQTRDASQEWIGQDSATGKITSDYKYYVEIQYTTAGSRSASAGTYLYLLSTSAAGCINRVAADTAKYEFPDQFGALSGGYQPSWPSNEIFCN